MWHDPAWEDLDMRMFFRSRLLVLPCALLLVCSCRTADTTLSYSGKTMGTTYNVVAVAPADTPSVKLGKAIEASLRRVNRHLSNWDPKSEVSRFNAATVATPIAVSDMMVKVVAAANAVHRDSLGHFDVTLAPLISLWGFGRRTPEQPFPSVEKIEAARSQVGQAAKLSLDESARTLTKLDPGVTVNLAAIAKGYGVDEVAATLRQFGIENYMVEIGGDLVTRGRNARGRRWRIGIEKPDPAGRSIQLTVDIGALGMATSGDYRNYREKDGIRYSHILSVRTGRPITHKTASVTVLADSAMLADAWATALLALGMSNGMKIARKHNLAALFIYRAGDQDGEGNTTTFATAMSPRFADIKAGK